MAKRLSKEQLETDPLLTSYYIFTSFLKRNLTAVITISAMVLILVSGGLGYFFYSQIQERQAQVYLVGAEKAFENEQYASALMGSDDNSNPGFLHIINQYGRTKAGNLARYYAAVSESELGNYEEALSLIREFQPPEGILGVGSIAFHASLLATLNLYDEAARLYIRAAEWDLNEATTPQYLLNAAQALLEDGQYERALQITRRIVREYENSFLTDEARRLEGMLIARM